MKNYENRLEAIKRLADSKTARVAFIDYKDGKYYQDGKRVDISTIKATVILIADIPSDEDLSVPPTPPEFLEKGDDMKNENNG